MTTLERISRVSFFALTFETTQLIDTQCILSAGSSTLAFVDVCTNDNSVLKRNVAVSKVLTRTTGREEGVSGESTFALTEVAADSVETGGVGSTDSVGRALVHVFAPVLWIARESRRALAKETARCVDALGTLTAEWHCCEAFILVEASFLGRRTAQVAGWTRAAVGSGQIGAQTARTARIVLALVDVCKGVW